MDMASFTKIKSRDQLVPFVREHQASGKRVGYTSGVFDLMHAGHIEYLEEARRHCDLLIVGVNSDESVKSFKGERRPICPEDSRVKVVAGLA